MSNPNDLTPGRGRRRLHRLVAATGIALATVAGALLVHWPVGAAPSATDRVAPAAPPAPAVVARAPATYQLRCWQYGRLLFDEGPVTLGPEARQGAKMVALDRNGAAVIVTEAGEATCIARPSPPPPSLALPR